MLDLGLPQLERTIIVVEVLLSPSDAVSGPGPRDVTTGVRFMQIRFVSLLVPVLLASLTGSPASASASLKVRKQIYAECQTAAVQGTYSQADYVDALRNIQTDLDEYSDCRDVIRRAQLAALGPKRSSGPTPGTASDSNGDVTTPSTSTTSAGGTVAQMLSAASPAERAAVTTATNVPASEPTLVGGKLISPSVSGLSPAGAANVVPVPLVVVLVLLGTGLVAGGISSLRSMALRRKRT